MFDLDRRRFAATLLAAAALPTAARAQGLTLDDLLNLEGLGRRTISPDGRWLVVEHRGPYRSAVRFDFDRLNDLMRTRILRFDLSGQAPDLALTPPGRAHGYALGDLSPDGAHALVYRVSPDGFECGLAELESGQLSWTGISGDWFDVARPAQWRSAQELLVISPPPGRPPMLLRHLRPHAPLAERWARSTQGLASSTVIGAGRYGGESPHDPPKALMRLGVGKLPEVLAHGDFADLEISPDGRRVALMVAGENLPLRADAPVQGDNGMAVRARRLRILDLQTGRLSDPAPDLDLIGQPLAWSPSGARLMVYARRPGELWREGRLKLLEASSGRVSEPDVGHLQPLVLSRPELVRAGWLGETPVVYARLPGSPRADWWRLGRKPVALTAGLAQPPLDGLGLDATGVTLVADGALLRIDRRGAVQRLAADASQVMPFREGLLPRVGWTVLTNGRLSAEAGPKPREALAAGGGRPLYRQPAPLGADLLDVQPGRGVLGLRQDPAGREQLIVADSAGAERSLLRLNAHLAGRTLPAVRAVHHRGSAGEPLVSWLVSPTDAPLKPPPLVVWPYPGLVLGAPPERLHPRINPGLEPVFLLAARGYAVLLPSLPQTDAGPPPAVGLAKRILEVVDAAAVSPALARAFDPARLGVWGHSFGGYAAVAVIGQTDRFKAAVSMAGITNLFSKWGEFGPMRRVWPEDGLYTPGWTEDLQPQMGGPPWADPSRYVAGSPMFDLAQCRTPLLLFHGDQDAIPLAQSEAAFIALQRQDRDVMLVTYWGEGHVVRSPGNMRDYYGRSLAWFDRHLREVR